VLTQMKGCLRWFQASRRRWMACLRAVLAGADARASLRPGLFESGPVRADASSGIGAPRFERRPRAVAVSGCDVAGAVQNVGCDAERIAVHPLRPRRVASAAVALNSTCFAPRRTGLGPDRTKAGVPSSKSAVGVAEIVGYWSLPPRQQTAVILALAPRRVVIVTFVGVQSLDVTGPPRLELGTSCSQSTCFRLSSLASAFLDSLGRLASPSAPQASTRFEPPAQVQKE